MEHAGRHHRRSIRLKGYDYTSNGSYFVTICVQGKDCLFGRVKNGEKRLNRSGLEVAKCWMWLAERYPYVRLDQWVVMPNHMHGIIVHTDERRHVAGTNGRGRGGLRTAHAGFQGQPTMDSDDAGLVPSKRKSLGRLIGAFKTVSTARINDLRSNPGARIWQRN